MANIEFSKVNDTREKAAVAPTDEDFAKAEQSAMQRVGAAKKVPGFRKGKVPPHILKSKFEGEIFDETVHKLVNGALPEIAEKSEKGIYQLIGVENLNRTAGNITFDVVYDTPPVVELGKLKDITIKEHIAKISDSDIEEEINKELRKRAEFKPAAEGDSATKGDQLEIDYEIWENDVPRGEPVKSYKITLGDKQFDPDIETMMIDKPAKAGDKFQHKREIPVQQGEGDEADKKAELEISVTVNAINKPELPELNEEQIKKFNEKLNNKEDLNQHIQERLETRFKNINMKGEIDKAIDKLVSNSKILLPESYLISKVNDYLKERQVEIEKVPEDQIEQLKAAIQDNENRTLVTRHVIDLQTRKNGEQKPLRERLDAFLREEYNETDTGNILSMYDMAVEKDGQVDQVTGLILNNILDLYHNRVLEQFFRDNDLFKKGKKFTQKELEEQYK